MAVLTLLHTMTLQPKRKIILHNIRPEKSFLSEYHQVNQPEQLDQSDSCLPTKVLAYETVIFYACWINKREIIKISRIFEISKKSLAEIFPAFLSDQYRLNPIRPGGGAQRPG